MVALVIGLFLIVGAVTIYRRVAPRSARRRPSRACRPREYAFDVLEPEIQIANWLRRCAPTTSRRRPRDAAASPPPSPPTRRSSTTAADDSVLNLDESLSGNDDTSQGADSPPTPATMSPVDSLDLFVVRRILGDANPTNNDSVTSTYKTRRVRGARFVAEDLNCSTPSSACLPSGYAPPQSRTPSCW